MKTEEEIAKAEKEKLEELEVLGRDLFLINYTYSCRKLIPEFMLVLGCWDN